jgi:peptide deformylase
MVVTDINTLRMRSVRPLKAEVIKIVRLLEEELRNYPNGIGLSAIQIGFPLRLAIIRAKDFSLNLIDSEILESYGCTYVTEECLSLPNVTVKTKRAPFIKLKNSNGVKSYKDQAAVVIQHELDHWDGILITDRKMHEVL